ncbi:ornithine cyclodeaminase family protein [Alicyclobacillus sendaiensis]|uniref:Ornithine cyclodeaminase family protein n=1 Tax=Alicyclobacillus sendaiensis PA2 TaxID=3029425 RepID=A0ABT6XX52_ALISE|nr:ornithine cyclodeaminase family protein [Alicyclobacillus sendaiensis]MDI9259582.1 ornithine cyclodeaminase family protein [Alicyclobacillus sendaiensis PA2]
MRIIQDAEVRSLIDMATAISVMERAFTMHVRGELHAPPRFHVENDRGRLVFTAGAANGDDGCMGFRVYPALEADTPEGQQFVAVYGRDGVLEGIVLGDALGQMRTGAIGGVAIKYMARRDARVLAVIGTGRQAETQLEAAVQVRHFEEIRVYSRHAEKRMAFVGRMSKRLGRDIVESDRVERCVRGADVVICATNSRTPVFDPTMLASDVHINTVGPKWVGAHEIPRETVQTATRLVTDSIAQMTGYSEPHISTIATKPVIELGELLATQSCVAPDRLGITVFFSVGLAGTEMLLAREVLRRVRSEGTECSEWKG